MKFPFEATAVEIKANPDAFVDAVFSCLESEFLVMPKGEGFVEYPVFEQGYEALKRVTAGFSDLSPGPVLGLATKQPIVLIVLRAMLGFTPPEWAYIATQRGGLEVSQGAARAIDRKIRLAPIDPLRAKGVTLDRITALVTVACALLNEGAPETPTNRVHRLSKADSRAGLDSLRSAAELGAPYAMLLYERFLGRPFAGHRDSVSDLVGGNFEVAIEEVLSKAGISFRKTKRAQKLPTLDQTPDFVIPDEHAPQVVIEAKVSEDDGTARDKVTRILRLVTLSKAIQPGRAHGFEVVACLAGRGFGQRRADMRRLILETEGKVFTPQNLDQLIPCTRLQSFVSTP